MSTVVVGVGDAQVTSNPEDTLVTYALGSCIAVIIHDPAANVGGLLHFMLPESNIDLSKAEKNPNMFADTGIPLLFRTAYKLGADKKRMKVGVFGGAQVMDDNSLFNIGKRNHAALRKIFWKAGVFIHKEAVGGSTARTVRLEVSTGKMWVRGPGQPECEV